MGRLALAAALACVVSCSSDKDNVGDPPPGSDPPVIDITEIHSNDPAVLTIDTYSKDWEYWQGPSGDLSRIEVFDSSGAFKASSPIGPAYFSPGWPASPIIATTAKEHLTCKYNAVRTYVCGLGIGTGMRFRLIVHAQHLIYGTTIKITTPCYLYKQEKDCTYSCIPDEMKVELRMADSRADSRPDTRPK